MSGIQFSQKALEKSNRNSSNYALASIKSRWTWLLLTAVTLFFAAMIFWGFYGSMVRSVNGVGITMLSHESRPVVAATNGTISHLNIQSGSTVKVGQVIGQIYDAETFFNIQKLATEYKLLKEQIETLKASLDRLSEKQKELGEKKQNYLQHLSKEYDQAKVRTTEISEMYRKLKSIDAVSMVSYYQSLDQGLQTEAALISTVIQNIAAELENESALWSGQQNLTTLQQQLDSKKYALDLAEQLYHDTFWIRAEHNGTVREVLKEDGSFVQRGEKITIIDSNPDSGIYLLAFVSAEDGKKIKNGMSAFFAPSAISANDYGYMRCVVRMINNQANTVESIEAELMNSSLTQMIAGKTAMVRVVLEIIPDKKNLSKYSWTSNEGAPTEITSGMLGQLTINTEYLAPASYIVPAIRKFIHGDDIKAAAEEQ